MGHLRRFVAGPGLLALFLTLAASPSPAEEDLLITSGDPGRPGGTLVVALRAEPKTFNPLLAIDNPTLTVARRLMADLVHIDRETQHTVAALARTWSVSPDGRRYVLDLRRGIRFSDGEPFDADDVLFTFEILLDEEVGAPHRDVLMVGGEPITVSKLGSHQVAFELKQPYAVGERLFDSIPILPEHRLAEAYAEGGLATAWGLGTPPGEIAGLGPFRLEKHVPGERLEMVRNPHYWKVDAKGRRLPYLDRLTFLFVASADAQAIRFQAGDTHLTNRLGAKSFRLLESEQARRGYQLRDLGAGLNYAFLFFNLNDLTGKELPAVARKQAWFRQVAFRRAVSAAIDRAGIVRLVYQGRATPVASHVSAGNKLWHNAGLEPPKRSLVAARALLREAGFTWDEAGRLHEASGTAVEFSILTSSSNEERKEIATIVQADLGELGITVQVVPLEFRGDARSRLRQPRLRGRHPGLRRRRRRSQLGGLHHHLRRAQPPLAPGWGGGILAAGDRPPDGPPAGDPRPDGAQAALRPGAAAGRRQPAGGLPGQPQRAGRCRRRPGQFPAGDPGSLHPVECRRALLAH